MPLTQKRKTKNFGNISKSPRSSNSKEFLEVQVIDDNMYQEDDMISNDGSQSLSYIEEGDLYADKEEFLSEYNESYNGMEQELSNDDTEDAIFISCENGQKQHEDTNSEDSDSIDATKKIQKYIYTTKKRNVLNTKKENLHNYNNKNKTIHNRVSRTQLIQDQDCVHLCDICGNIFNDRERLIEHRKKHKESRFVCKLCDNEFHLRENLHKHMLTHHTDKPHKCSFCSRSFFYENVKKAHEHLHMNAKISKCRICNKAFPNALSLKKHRLTHTAKMDFAIDKMSQTRQPKQSATLVDLFGEALMEKIMEVIETLVTDELKNEINSLTAKLTKYMREIKSDLTAMKSEIAGIISGFEKYEANYGSVMPVAPFVTKSAFQKFNKKFERNTAFKKKLKNEILQLFTHSPKQSVVNCWKCVLDSRLAAEYTWSKFNTSREGVHECAYNKILEEAILEKFPDTMNGRMYYIYCRRFFKTAYERNRKKNQKSTSKDNATIDQGDKQSLEEEEEEVLPDRLPYSQRRGKELEEDIKPDSLENAPEFQFAEVVPDKQSNKKRSAEENEQSASLETEEEFQFEGNLSIGAEEVLDDLF